MDRTAHALAELFFIVDSHQFDLVLIDTLCEDAIANGHQAQLLPALIAFLRDSEKLFDHTSGTFDTTTPAQRLLLPLCEYALESFLSKRALKRGHEGEERKRKEENGDDEPTKEMDEETVGAFLLLFREEGSTTSLVGGGRSHCVCLLEGKDSFSQVFMARREIGGPVPILLAWPKKKGEAWKI